MKRVISSALLGLLGSACATAPTASAPPPAIPLDTAPIAAIPSPEPPKPVAVVAIAEPLPLPAQLKPVELAPTPRPADIPMTVTRANDEARVTPARDGYINAIQVWPYSEGALYQVYASPGRVTDIVLQEGEALTSVSAGDTVRWIVGDTTSASGAAKRVHVLVKPIRSPLKTNLVITTAKRVYLLELTATEQTWMASVSWDYPRDRLLALQRGAQRADASAPIAQGIALERLAFRYDVTGDAPSWKPLRAFDDGEHVYIQFPSGVAQGELPPLFVIGAAGDAELVNYRYRAPYYVVDRLFGAAELRLGGEHAKVVRITRNDVKAKAS
jgi:type IV secretion system protein TrbG